jgi:SAM-dependent methyltransferase
MKIEEVVADNKKVRMGDYSPTFRIGSTPLSGPSFNDHFSGVAAGYATFRPTYPAWLYAAIAQAAQKKRCVWDVGCGSGQASVALADHFDEVVATDASSEQIGRAQFHPTVRYAVAPAEASGLPSHSCNAITIAQALHWFDHARFFAEVRRVATPNAPIVAWAYGRMACAADIKAIFDDYYDHIVGPFWPPEGRHADNGYSELPWPFPRIDFGVCELAVDWTLDEFAGYIGTWSATARYRKARGQDPVPALHARLAAVWGRERRTLRWPLRVLAGRVT